MTHEVTFDEIVEKIKQHGFTEMDVKQGQMWFGQSFVLKQNQSSQPLAKTFKVTLSEDDMHHDIISVYFYVQGINGQVLACGNDVLKAKVSFILRNGQWVQLKAK